MIRMRCNLCDQCGGVDSIITKSIPERGIWMGDTYHFGHLPPDVESVTYPIAWTTQEDSFAALNAILDKWSMED